MMICPVKGQLQASIGATWQVDVTVFPVLSIAVQLVQWEVTLALAGVISSAALRMRATKLTSKRIVLFFTVTVLSFCPMTVGDDGDKSAPVHDANSC